jgi:hypothetical protein
VKPPPKGGGFLFEEKFEQQQALVELVEFCLELSRQNHLATTGEGGVIFFFNEWLYVMIFVLYLCT